MSLLSVCETSLPGVSLSFGNCVKCDIYKYISGHNTLFSRINHWQGTLSWLISHIIP